MRKANKILMATVAILLCLVLISTSVVSGVFARFVITQSAMSVISFGKFGVDVTMTSDYDEYLTSTTIRGESATMAFEGIPLRPGTDFSDAVNIKFEGIPNVKVRVRVLFHIDYNSTDTANTTVPVGVGGNDDNTRYFMPLGFTFGAKDANDNVIIENQIINQPWMNSVDFATFPAADTYNATPDKCEQSIRKGIMLKLGDSTKADALTVNSQSDYGFYFDFDPNSTTAATKNDIKTNGIHFHAKNSTQIIKQFELGFEWPIEYVDSTGKYDYDVIGTYLAQNADETKPIKIWFTVRLDQIA